MFEIFAHECTPFFILVPPKSQFPCLYYWFINIKQFTPHAIRSWHIKSDNDEYFLLILKNYRKWKDRKDNLKPLSVKIIDFDNLNLNFPKLVTKSEYAINICLKVN